MTKIISILNHKGGVGKTTTVVNVAAALSQSGYSVLVIDMDGQCNATVAMIGKGYTGVSIYESLEDKLGLQRLNVSENLSLCPSSKKMAQIDIALGPRMGREYILKEALTPRSDLNVDFVLIDCPPSQGLSVVNALTASDYVLVPLQGESFAYDGLTRVNETITLVQKISNPNLKLLGVFLTMLNPRRELSKTVRAGAKKMYGSDLLETEIRVDVRLAEAPTARQDIFQYAPLSNGASDYAKLTVEILKKLNNG